MKSSKDGDHINIFARGRNCGLSVGMLPGADRNLRRAQEGCRSISNLICAILRFSLFWCSRERPARAGGGNGMLLLWC
ncbi:hypothetical protein ASZ90_009399 [hydrocarbon metagenome]|uniref:Uncharacterized protein n=1 Tax=hydrocarbon metagenome TaxID=938273 RepID=A0A0W8FIV9_9ZZZZ